MAERPAPRDEPAREHLARAGRVRHRVVDGVTVLPGDRRPMGDGEIRGAERRAHHTDLRRRRNAGIAAHLDVRRRVTPAGECPREGKDE